jgi:hypothetical protein
MPEQPANSVTAFISYSWDDELHKEWVRELAARLRRDGIAVVLDQWELQPGDQLPAFMEAAVRDNDYVLVVCTPHYKERSDSRQGGVGYEGDIMAGELLTQRNQRKFIPLLRAGDSGSAVPSWLAGKYYVDLRGEPLPQGGYADLLNTLLGTRESAPHLGSLTGQQDHPRNDSAPTPRTAEDSGPIRILGVVVDEVTEPRLDGTAGSALYRVPFRLSRRPSLAWARLFESTWDHPPRQTLMHRSGILSVQGDRLILDGTTIEEIASTHRQTLELVLDQVNRETATAEEQQRQQRLQEQKRKDEHRRNVEEAAKRLRFDE